MIYIPKCCFRRLAFGETQELGFRQGSVQQARLPNLNYVAWRQKPCSRARGHISLLQDFTIAEWVVLDHSSRNTVVSHSRAYLDRFLPSHQHIPTTMSSRVGTDGSKVVQAVDTLMAHACGSWSLTCTSVTVNLPKN